MHLLKKSFIIGITLLLGLTLHTESVYALYSPTISNRVSLIARNIQSARTQNGAGSLLSATDSLKENDRERRAQGQVTGIPGNAKAAQSEVFEDNYNFVISHPFDALFMVFNINLVNNEIISNCLRDDIWTLEVMRDIVSQEMIKAYMMFDTYHGDLLSKDYKYLVKTIDLLRKYGSNPGAYINVIDGQGNQRSVTSNEYFFGTPGSSETINYYVYTFEVNIDGPDQSSCPEGDFEGAFEQVLRSWEVFKAMLGRFGGETWDFNNIWEVAKIRARQRARQWIQANQVSLTIGGENGARPQSLVKGGGLDRFVGSVKTQIRILKDMIGPVTPFFDWDNYTSGRGDIEEGCVVYDASDDEFYDCSSSDLEEYDRCKDDEDEAELAGIACDRFKDKNEVESIVTKLNNQVAAYQERGEVLEEAETAFIYNLNLNNVGEQNIYAVDQELFFLNRVIERGYEGVDRDAGPGLPSLERQLSIIYNRQCANK